MMELRDGEGGQLEWFNRLTSAYHRKSVFALLRLPGAECVRCGKILMSFRTFLLLDRFLENPSIPPSGDNKARK